MQLEENMKEKVGEMQNNIIDFIKHNLHESN